MNGRVDDFVVDDAGHHAALALAQAFDGGDAQSAGQNPIKVRGTATSLDMAQDGHLHFVPIELLGDLASNFVGSALFFAFGHNNETRAFVVGSAFFEDFNQFAEVGFGFGDQDIFATGRNACVEAM